MYTLAGGLGIGAVLGWSIATGRHHRADVTVLVIALTISVLAVRWMTDAMVAGASLGMAVGAYGLRRALSRVVRRTRAAPDNREVAR